MVRLRDVPRLRPLWAHKHDLGEVSFSPPASDRSNTDFQFQRNLLRRRRRAIHRPRHHERFRLCCQRLATLPRIPRRRRTEVPQGFHLLDDYVCGAGGDHVGCLVHAEEGPEKEGQYCCLRIDYIADRAVGMITKFS